VRHATERLAVLDGDIEAIVALLGQDLSSPHQYTRVAWARVVESILETTDRRAYRAAVKQLKNAGRAAAAAGLAAEHHAYLVGLREEHRRRPSLAAMLVKLIAG